MSTENGYQLLVGPDKHKYVSGGSDTFPLSRAKVIARNIAKKRKVTVTLHKVEEIVNWDTSYDQIQAYVDSLKGKALTAELKQQGLPLGGDSVASKRVRLVMHFVKRGSV